MKKFARASLVALIMLGVVLALVSNNLFAQPEKIHGRAMIKPSLIYLMPGEKKQFKVVMLATRLMAAGNPEMVKWSVNDIAGGNKELGAINEEGVYQAPHKIPKPCEVHICGYTEEAQNSHLFATVIIGDAPPKYKSLRIWTEKEGNP